METYRLIKLYCPPDRIWAVGYYDAAETWNVFEYFASEEGADALIALYGSKVPRNPRTRLERFEDIRSGE